MDIFITIYIGLVGLLIGSFLNVVIYRLPHGETIVHGRSHCPSCSHPLAGLDLVPVVSFLLLGRQCRYCKAPISWRYMIIELSAGVFFTAAAYSIKPWTGTAEAIVTATACVLFCVLLADAMIQFDGHDSHATKLFVLAVGTVIAASAIGAVLRLPASTPWWDHLLGLAVGLMLMSLPVLGKSTSNLTASSVGHPLFRVHPMSTALPIAGLSIGLLQAWPVLAVGFVLVLPLLAARHKQSPSQLFVWLGRLLPLLVLIACVILLFSDYI